MTRPAKTVAIKNVAVVGAGIAGSLMAYQLIRLGYKVTVYEPDLKQKSCSYTAAGMLAPMAELESADNGVYNLGQSSLKLWPIILKQLKNEFDQDVFFSNKGTLVINHIQDQGSFDQFYSSLKLKLGVSFNESCKAVQMASFESELSQFDKGLLLMHEAQVDSHQLLSALHAVINEQGRWLNQPVQSIEPKLITLMNGCSHPYDWVFDCRGLSASEDVPGLHGVRGERILVHAPQVNIDHMIRLMHPRYRLYIVPRQNNHYLIGATELESTDDGPISVRSTLELLSAAFSVHSGFAEARILDMRTGLRPARFDHQPYLKTRLGLTTINGFYRHGYLIGPAMIEKALYEMNESIKKNGRLFQENAQEVEA